MRASMFRRSHFREELPDSALSERNSLLVPTPRYSQLSRQLNHKASAGALEAVGDNCAPFSSRSKRRLRQTWECSDWC